MGDSLKGDIHTNEMKEWGCFSRSVFVEEIHKIVGQVF